MQAEIISMLIEVFGVAVVSVVAKILVRVIKEYQVEAEVKRAVKAAEILFNAPSSGEKKKQWVKDSILSVFHPQWLTEQRLEMFIEAAVAALKGFSN